MTPYSSVLIFRIPRPGWCTLQQIPLHTGIFLYRYKIHQLTTKTSAYFRGRGHFEGNWQLTKRWGLTGLDSRVHGATNSTTDNPQHFSTFLLKQTFIPHDVFLWDARRCDFGESRLAVCPFPPIMLSRAFTRPVKQDGYASVIDPLVLLSARKKVSTFTRTSSTIWWAHV